jgi:hypothetical protein
VTQADRSVELERFSASRLADPWPQLLAMAATAGLYASGALGLEALVIAIAAVFWLTWPQA